MPDEKTLDAAADLVDEALNRLHTSRTGVVNSAEQLAREARACRRVSQTNMPAVRPPLPRSELTGKFAALK